MGIYAGVGLVLVGVGLAVAIELQIADGGLNIISVGFMITGALWLVLTVLVSPPRRRRRRRRSAVTRKDSVGA